VVAKAAERTARTAEKRMVFKERQRLEGLDSEQQLGRRRLAKGVAHEGQVYITGLKGQTVR